MRKIVFILALLAVAGTFGWVRYRHDQEVRAVAGTQATDRLPQQSRRPVARALQEDGEVQLTARDLG